MLSASGAFALDVIGVAGLTIGPEALDRLTQPAIQAWATVLAAVVIQSPAFLLAAPAVNPVAPAATSVVFPGRPRIVLARLLTSRSTACPPQPPTPWVTATGTWLPAAHDPTLDAGALTRIPEPAHPYRDSVQP